MIRLAMIGLGAAARNIHLPAYSLLRDRVQVVAASDPDSAARAMAREKWGVSDVHEDARAMLEKTKLDVVSVCTPPVMHRDHSLLALEAGCHVFCEKPLADNLQQADEMIRAAAKASRLLVVNNQFPSMNIHQAAKRRIGSPEFGRLLYLHAWETMTPTEFTESGWRGQLDRRLCFEFGIHVFDLIRFFFDAMPVRLLAHMPRPQASVRADLVNVISVEFADGRAASMVLDRLSKGPERYLDLRLDGEQATIHTSLGGRLQFAAGMHTRERRPFVEFDYALGGRAVLQTGNRSRVIARDGLNPFATATARHLGAFLGALQTGKEPFAQAKDNRNTLALVMAAYDSASSGRAVELADYAPGHSGDSVPR